MLKRRSAQTIPPAHWRFREARQSASSAVRHKLGSLRAGMNLVNEPTVHTLQNPSRTNLWVLCVVAEQALPSNLNFDYNIADVWKCSLLWKANQRVGPTSLAISRRNCNRAPISGCYWTRDRSSLSISCHCLERSTVQTPMLCPITSYFSRIL